MAEKGGQQIKVEDNILNYAVQIVRGRAAFSRWGSRSPRAALSLMHCAKASAAIAGQDYITPDNIKRVARPVLCHRLFLLPEAEVEGRSVGQIIDKVLSAVPVPR